MEGVSREEFNTSLNRVHDRIDGIGSSVDRQEVIVERIEKSVDKLHSVMYGNGKDGLITRVSNLFKDRWIIRGIALGLFGLAFYIIRKGL